MDKIVYTYGVWDMLHRGHINVIKQAKKLGGKLVVGVWTDKLAESFKRKPVVDEDERHFMIEQLRDVDMVLFQDKFSPEDNIKLIGANIVCKGPGSGWTDEHAPTFEGCESIILQYTKGVSTTSRIERIKNDY
jgi:cytidyltransferase-like protein